MMSTHLLAAAPPVALSSSGLVTYLQTLFGPLFLGIVGIVAIFFLFTREILRFVQFFVLAVAIAVIFYVPGIVRTLAMGLAHALGVLVPRQRTRAPQRSPRQAEGDQQVDLPTYTSIWRIEKRLYKLYDFRLPMPLPIGQVAVFAAIAVPYVVLLTVLGLPFNHTLIWLYVLPPGLATWLVTRPGLESKRLPELIKSQLRYLAEPRVLCRMAPLAERDVVLVTARVWRPRASRTGRRSAETIVESAIPAPAHDGGFASQPAGTR